MPRLPENRDEAILTSKSVLFVEGKDEVGLFKALIKDMGLTLGVDIQVWSADGKDNYRPKFAAFLRVPGFEQVRSYGLIRDADQNAENALRSVQHMLRDEGNLAL